MSQTISDRISAALAADRSGPRWQVTGLDVYGEQFTIDGYHTRYDAQDYADEVNAKGGEVTVERTR